MPFSRGSFKPRFPTLQMDSLPSEPPGKPEVTNRSTGLDLIERVPEELWTEVHDIVQKAVIKTIPKKKKCKKAEWLSEEALQIAEKRREAKVCSESDMTERLNWTELNCLYLLFFTQLFVRPPPTPILPFCISFSWGWSWSLPPVQCHEPLSIVLQALYHI